MRSQSLMFAALFALCLPSAALAAPITGQISISGYAEPLGSSGFGSATGMDFATGAIGTYSGMSGGLTSYGAGSGSFGGFACANAGGGCGTIMDISSFASEGPTASFLTLTTGAPAISFDLSNIVSITKNATTNSLTFTANGTLNFTGYDPTPGELLLTVQGSGTSSFSATLLAGSPAVAATPEPASFVLFATGLAGVAGLCRRRCC